MRERDDERNCPVKNLMRISQLLGLSVMLADAWTVPGTGALRSAHPLRAAGGRMNAGDLLGRLFSGGASKDPWPVEQCTAPTWEELRAMHDAQATEEQLGFRARLESGRGDAASLATIRRFDAPDGEEPRVTLYRDTASWCPYCEKVWLVLEEKRVPYRIEKVNMNCYGSKPASFLKIQPSGGIPVASLDGTVIRESNDILYAIEAAFPERPLIPSPSEASHVRVRLDLSLTLTLATLTLATLTVATLTMATLTVATLTVATLTMVQARLDFPLPSRG